MVFLVLILALSFAFSKPIMDSFQDVKRFPFVTYKRVWVGTPAESEEVTVPNVVIAYGKRESPPVVSVAGEIAYYLGQWTEDVGLNPRDVRKGRIPGVVMPLRDALKTDKHIILVGTRNRIVREMGLSFRGPTLKVVDYSGRKVLIVGGRNDKEIVKAGRFLASRIIGFKAGAYRTFFSFVKLRGLIEKGNYEGALSLIEDPSGLSACGKNMSLAAPMMLRFPQEVKKVVKKRNRIMYVKLVEVLKAGNGEEARRLWREAMKTCYMCHQGITIERLRKFVPNPEIHSRHQRIARDFGLNCTACHRGVTEIRGY
ncbi:MAG: cellulose biosynthesis cyclic di-GMP-binding regulatory protein BcsB [Aquificota bacterium]|nr:cellulose biosynthesis cyclic di-GMP-binding regulatory protein BcsB [Aquificota bacterium]